MQALCKPVAAAVNRCQQRVLWTLSVEYEQEEEEEEERVGPWLLTS